MVYTVNLQNFDEKTKKEKSMDWKMVVILVLAAFVISLLRRARRTKTALNDAEMELRCANTCLAELLRQQKNGTGGICESDIAVSADTNMTAEDEAELEGIEYSIDHGNIRTT